MIGALISLTLALAIIWPQSSQYGLNIALAYVWIISLAEIGFCCLHFLLSIAADVTKEPNAELEKFRAEITKKRARRFRWVSLTSFGILLGVMAGFGAIFTTIVAVFAAIFYHGLCKRIAEKEST